MHPRLTNKMLVLAAGIVWSATMNVGAQEKLPPYTVKVNSEYGVYGVTANYDLEKARAGEQRLKIEVNIMRTPGQDKLRLVECSRCKSESSIFSGVSLPFPADGEETRPGETDPNPFIQTRFTFEVGIKPATEARQYDIELRFATPPRPEPENQLPDLFGTFPLNVGVGYSEEGRLSVVADPKAKPDSCTSGQSHRFALKLKNSFGDYPINLQKITINTVPSDLVGTILSKKLGTVDQNTITFDPPLTIAHGQKEDLTVDLQMAGMTAGNYLSGFDEESQVEFSFKYDDGYGRTINYAYAKPLRMQPGWSVLAVAVMLGISAGVFLMSVWKILKYEGDLVRKGMAVAATAVIGLIVSLLVLTGQLNISLAALNVRASYDKPLTLFIMSLIATVSGTPLLKKFFGLDKPSAGTPPAPTPTPAPASPQST
jgi:hypothetical protein